MLSISSSSAASPVLSLSVPLDWLDPSDARLGFIFYSALTLVVFTAGLFPSPQGIP